MPDLSGLRSSKILLSLLPSLSIPTSIWFQGKPRARSKLLSYHGYHSQKKKDSKGEL